MNEQSMQKRILVIGAASRLGGRVAQRLAAEWGGGIMGMDGLAPAGTPPFDFVQATLSAPQLTDFLKWANVGLVCHLGQDGVSTAEKVGATKHLLMACDAAGVEKIVLTSSTSIYGARATNPAFLSELKPAQGSRDFADNGYWLEMEAFCRGFQLQHPALKQVVLRFANVVGPTVDSSLTGYLSRPVVPVLAGFNPLLQLIHEDDVVTALAQATIQDVTGVFNVAADGPLPLKRIIGLAHRPVLPFLWASRAVFPFDPDYVRYRWVADLSKMKQEWGFSPEKLGSEAIQPADYPRPQPATIPRSALARDGKQLAERLAGRQ